MDVREKLIGLIVNAKYICENDYYDHVAHVERIGDKMDGWAENASKEM